MRLTVHKVALALFGAAAIIAVGLYVAYRTPRADLKPAPSEQLQAQAVAQDYDASQPTPTESAAQPATSGTGVSATPPRSAPESVVRVVLNLDDGENLPESLELLVPTGASVLTALEAAANMEGWALDVNYSYRSMGAFVRQIGEKKNGEGARYWQYWVNGKQPLIAADRLQLKAGDRVEWKFAKSAM